MTIDLEKQIAARRAALPKLEEARAASAAALGTCADALKVATHRLAGSKTPTTRKAFLDARDNHAVAQVEAEAAAKAFDAARAELAAFELDHARAEHASALGHITREAFLRSIDPEIVALLQLSREEGTIATTIVAKIKAHDAEVEKVATLARRAGICPPGRSGVDLGIIREEVIRRRRAEVPVLANVPDVHEWVSSSATVYAT